MSVPMPFSMPLGVTPRRVRAALLLALALAAVAGPAAAGDDPEGVEVRRGNRVSVFGGSLRVGPEEVRRGDVICVGCAGVEVEGDVRGQVVVVFGSLRLDGAEVRDGVVGIGADLDLRRCRIGEQLVNVGGTLDQDDCSVDGQTMNLGPLDWLGGVGLWKGSLAALLLWWRLFGLLCVFAILMLLLGIAPDRIRAMADEAPVRYAPAFFVGLLAYALWPLILALLAFTVVGVPVWWLGFKIFKWMGCAALLFLLGRRIGRLAGRELSLAGGALLGFAVYAAVSTIPLLLGPVGIVLAGVLSAFLFLFVQVPAVGLVILTRAGRPAPVAPTAMTPPPAPPPAAPPATGSDEPPGV